MLLGQRHPPPRLTGRGAGAEQVGGEGVVGGEQRAGAGPERGPRGPGERGDVDQHVGGELEPGVREGVGEHEPALGVGAAHLGGASADVGQHVTGPVGGPRDGVLGQRHQGGHPHGQPQPGDGVEHGEDGGPAGHVGVHLPHAGRGLDRDAPGVEGDALADQDHVRAHRGGRDVGGQHQPGRAVRAPADGEQPAEACGPQLPGTQDRGADPVVHAEAGLGLLGQPHRVGGVGRGVDQVPGPHHGGGGDQPAVQGVDGGGPGPRDDEHDAGEPGGCGVEVSRKR